MIRLKREQYAVGEAERDDVTVTVGIYYDPASADDIEGLTHIAQAYASGALKVWGGNHAGIVAKVQNAMDSVYPDRPFYVETREDGRGVQVYQPYGMPQDVPSNYGEGGEGEGSQAQVDTDIYGETGRSW